MIQALRRVPGPFLLATSDAAFAPDVLALLHAHFDTGAWERHQDSFYRCHLARIELPPRLVEAVRTEVAAVLGVALHPQVTVTAQRMEASDGSDRHTDRPAAGYEAARLVVQLDTVEGGVFRAFAGERIWLERPARPNHAVAFELSPHSEHDVTPSLGLRRTVVFHFWHPANPPDARARLESWFGDMSFGDLPAELDEAMLEAEATLDDEQTWRAAAVTWTLARLQCADLPSAYERALLHRPQGTLECFAGFLVDLHHEGFDREAWDALEPVGSLPHPLECWAVDNTNGRAILAP